MTKYVTKVGILCISILSTLALKAQEKGLDIDIDINKKEWYEQTWVLVTGGAIVLILIVLAVRKKS
jgi:hypothetical protein